MLKRSVDIAFAGLLLAVTLPLLIVAAILIKMDSEGPALFRQERMGRGFRGFRLLKLRTMRVSGEGFPFTLGPDPRITRLGRWLRWTKVDELPQLWNVLRGEMSMVGPRPVIPELTQEFKRAYDRLLEVRPGLTDPATLKYCREAELLALVAEPLKYFKAVVTPDKLRISQAYLKRASVWSDLEVMAKTAIALLALPWRPQALVPGAVRKRRVRPMFENAGAAELVVVMEDSGGLYHQAASNRLAYRHLREYPAPREWSR